MEKPIIFSIDDDQQVLNAIARDLKTKYNNQYKIISTTSAKEALERITELKNEARAIAMFICDQRMPEMEGVEFLEETLKIYPEAKRILLTAYSDTEAAINAINKVQLDYYLMKPWDPAEEKLYPVIDDLLADWQSDYKPDFKGLRVIGYQYSPFSHNIKDYLAANLIPYLWLDIEKNPEAQKLLDINTLTKENLPVVFLDDGSILKQPDIAALAENIGTNPEITAEIYDVVIIGAGPAGLAAAVYGASEGLRTLVVERKAPGGQAGTSSRIENYLGFPSGLTGADLTRRAISQARRLGAEFLSPKEVVDIKEVENYKILTLGDGQEINCRSIIITTGVDYRKLDTKGIEDFTGAGVYYGAAITEASACKNKSVYIVGGGNSAGQSAVYLSKFADKVYIIIRRDSLSYTMSSYLIQQIADLPNIEVLTDTEVREAKGDTHLENLIIEHLPTGETTTGDAAALYIFIGAKPFTDWLGASVRRDQKGFIETGRDLTAYPEFTKSWKLSRDPFLLETSLPGIFAAGDVRSGAMNRVASAVGEGSMAISFVHKYLAEN
ncbi:thioredoxin reductase (NADPH) [Chryseobacterium ginsenosidimutans]|uniref:FAD-dependent oxidoreductase n=1 Tax=Chryseobacterium ginsenosidimutans TaxID=687846 RepID=UPI00277D5AE2|nr:FAD-dependent oxidoreductase [Chryseobacterium ginsenosidimutans]MDQ0593863.1 thioredoxin reductase (NADPH) [Chryseobacterium ginsenosidimutans]